MSSKAQIFIILISCIALVKFTCPDDPLLCLDYREPSVFYSNYNDTLTIGDTLSVKVKADATQHNDCQEPLFPRDVYKFKFNLYEVIDSAEYDWTIGKNIEVIVDTSKYEVIHNYSVRGEIERNEDEFYLEFDIVLADTGLHYVRFTDFGQPVRFPYHLYVPRGEDDNYDMLVSVDEDARRRGHDKYEEDAAYTFYVKP